MQIKPIVSWTGPTMAAVISFIFFLSIPVTGTPNSADAENFRIFDGKPKYVLIANHWSWGLGGTIKGTFFANLGYPYLEGSSVGEYNYTPVTDSLTIDKKGWLASAAFAQSLSEKAKIKPVILYLHCAWGFAIKGPEDTARINLGVRKMLKMTEVLKSMGVSSVFYFSPHYTKRRARDTIWAEPANDSLLVNEYNRQTKSHFGVNLTTSTFRELPYSVQSDFEHPTALSEAYYGTGLLESMLKQEGQSIPTEAIAKHLSNGRNKARDYSNRIGDFSIDTPLNPTEVRIGSTLKVSVKSTDFIKGTSVRVLLACFKGGVLSSFTLDTTFQMSTGTITVTRALTIPDSGRIEIYSPVSGKLLPIRADSAALIALGGAGRGSVYKITKAFKLLNRDGSATSIAPQTRIFPRHINFSPWVASSGGIIRYRADSPDPFSHSVYDFSGRRIAEKKLLLMEKRQ